jgi:hypothetical protein
MKQPLTRSPELLQAVKTALTPQRLPLLIAIDGADGCGKTSLASWLGWQLGMPSIPLDVFVWRLNPLQWRIPELQRVLAKRVDDERRPVIIDSVLVLDALQQVGRKADYLIFVHGGGGSLGLQAQIDAYQARWRPQELADFQIQGYDE